ncbi:MAG: peptidoglycan editing factor PgeF [Megasphaera sp.]|jgi:YfiH family protein|nr:peptidoglycan editing factor PgeF [Megasphaera sp.]
MSTNWIEHENGICWEESSLLQRLGLCHGVAGRSGGVSTGIFTSMNMALHVDDDVQAVLENRRRFCETIGCSLQNFTTARQTHEDHIVAVGPAEIGSGAGSLADALDHTDALMTNQPYIPLIIFVADCVPIILYDAEHQACAVVHDGWRGTVQRLVAKTVFAMRLAYGTDPANLWAYIGPAISADHYDVSEDTADQFRAMGQAYRTCVIERLHTRSIDLWQANHLLLQEAGLQEDHIDISSSCVYSNHERFFSSRYDQGHTGRNTAFVMIRQK